MKKHLVFKDAESNKFWSIETFATSYTIFFGKIGTEGQPSYRSFDSAEKCLKAAEKRVKDQLKKGYTEKKATPKSVPSDQYYCSFCGLESLKQLKLCPTCGCINSFVLRTENKIPDKVIKEWKEIMNAKDLQKALVKHFSYLVDKPRHMPALTSLMGHAKKAEIKDGKLVIRLDVRGEEIIASPAAETSKYSKYPKSYQALMKVHEHLYLKKSWIYLGNDGGFDLNFLEESDWSKLKVKNAFVALTDSTDWWLYHPKEKNRSGEPTLHFFSHEDYSIGAEEVEKESLIGGLFIKKVIERLGLKVSVHPTSNNKLN